MQLQIIRIILEQFREAYTRLHEILTMIIQIPNTLECCNLRAGNWGADPSQGTALKGLLHLFLASFKILFEQREHKDLRPAPRYVDTCNYSSALMVCAAHLMYPSLQPLHQHSIRYRGTLVSGTVGHRAVTNLKVLHFCMICMIALCEFICVLSSIVPSCTFISPCHKILKIKFTAICTYTLLPLNSTRGYSDALPWEEPSCGRFCSNHIWTAQILV